MVLPRDELSIKLSHTGMRNGNMAIKVETTNQRGEKTTNGTAEVAQPLPSTSSPGKVLKSLA
jgi:fatty acid synthase subunit alpha